MTLTVVTGISVYVVMQRQSESILSKSLEASLRSSVDLVGSQIAQGMADTQMLATRPFIIDNLMQINATPGNLKGSIYLQRTAESFISNSFSGVAFYDARGAEVARSGQFLQQTTMNISLNAQHSAYLLWDRLFILHTNTDILDQQGRHIGSVMTEAGLKLPAHVFTDAISIGKTGEFALCAPLEEDPESMDCFLSQVSGKEFKHLKRVVDNQPLPMNYALDGKSGLIFAKDYRGEKVVAAYSPVGKLGLGMLLKIDQSELYSSVTGQLKYIASLMLALIVLGGVFLYSMVTPLVEKMLAAKRSWQHESKKNLALLQNSSDGIHILDINGNIIEISNSFCDMLGYRRDEMIGMNVSQWDACFTADELLVMVRQQFDNPKLIVFETRHRRKDGTIFYVEVSDVPLMLDGIPLLFCSSRNITERKLSEQKLQQSELKFSTLYNSTSDAVMMLNESGFIDCNKATLEIFGCLTKEEFCTKHPADISPPEQPCGTDSMVLANQRIATAMEKGNLRFDWVHKKLDTGENFPAEILLSSMFLGGKQVLQASVRDISERMKQEKDLIEMREQLAQASKMESVGHLTGGIAHDFNNMLGAILGYTELLKMRRAGEMSLPERTQNYIEQILTAGNRAKDLIAQMLLFSRLKADTSSGETPVILLQPVIKEVVHLLRSSIPSTIELAYHIADQHLKARIPPVQMHQILMNLAINARDAIGEYGRIDVTLSRASSSGICVACHHNFRGDYVEITVRDSGSGISDDLRSKIFDPFFTTKEVGKGTGMGLSVVHGIVHTLQGHIRLISSEAGTAIHILLPVAEEEIAGNTDERQSTDNVKDALSGLRIMVVDDEQIMMYMLEEFLGRYGAQVTTFNNPTEALTSFERNPAGFDLVITDEAMPGLSGLDMAKSMLKMKPGLPVLLCTGYSDHVNPEIAKQSGIAGFMYKPVDMSKMLQWIKDRRLNCV